MNLACLEKLCICLSFIFCCCEKDISMEDQVAEERYSGLNEDEGIRLDTIREEHWRYVA